VCIVACECVEWSALSYWWSPGVSGLHYARLHVKKLHGTGGKRNPSVGGGVAPPTDWGEGEGVVALREKVKISQRKPTLHCLIKPEYQTNTLNKQI